MNVICRDTKRSMFKILVYQKKCWPWFILWNLKIEIGKDIFKGLHCLGRDVSGVQRNKFEIIK